MDMAPARAGPSGRQQRANGVTWSYATRVQETSFYGTIETVSGRAMQVEGSVGSGGILVNASDQPSKMVL